MIQTLRATEGEERVSSRRMLLAADIENFHADILNFEAGRLRREVSSKTAGREVTERFYYLTYEEVVK